VRLQHISATLFDALSAPFMVGSRVPTVHSSTGIAVYPTDGTTTEELMKTADDTMYGAKQARFSSRSSQQLATLSPVEDASSADRASAVTRPRWRPINLLRRWWALAACNLQRYRPRRHVFDRATR